MVDGLRSKGKDIIAAREAGEVKDSATAARKKSLHRLVSSTNRRMHEGFPEMLSYLLRKPYDLDALPSQLSHVSCGRCPRAHGNANVQTV